jgi:hypothetical protein
MYPILVRLAAHTSYYSGPRHPARTFELKGHVMEHWDRNFPQHKLNQRFNHCCSHGKTCHTAHV